MFKIYKNKDIFSTGFDFKNNLYLDYNDLCEYKKNEKSNLISLPYNILLTPKFKIDSIKPSLIHKKTLKPNLLYLPTWNIENNNPNKNKLIKAIFVNSENEIFIFNIENKKILDCKFEYDIKNKKLYLTNKEEIISKYKKFIFNINTLDLNIFHNTENNIIANIMHRFEYPKDDILYVNINSLQCSLLKTETNEFIISPLSYLNNILTNRYIELKIIEEKINKKEEIQTLFSNGGFENISYEENKIVIRYWDNRIIKINYNDLLNEIEKAKTKYNELEKNL